MTDIAISSYCFHRLIKSGQARLEDTPRLARECGADCIEIATGGTLGPALDAATAARLADAADAADVAITGFALWANLLDAGNQVDEAAVAAVMSQVEAAASIGVDRVRHDAAWKGADDDCSDAAWDEAVFPLAKACRAIAAHGGGMGVKTSIENHGVFCASAARIAQLMQTVSHPNFGLTLDLGNLLWAPQDLLQSTAWLAPYAVTVHAKDFLVSSSDPAAWATFPGGPRVLPVATGTGNLPLGEQIDACLATDRDLVWVVEYEGQSGDVMAEVRRSFEWLHRQLG